MIGKLGGLAAIIAAVATSLTCYTVDQADQALVVRLGRPVRTINQPGLYVKWPLVDGVVIYDKRMLALEPPAEQIILGDQKRIEVDTYSRYRIADPLRYYQTVRTAEQAQSQLTQMISSSLRRELGQTVLATLLSEDRAAITGRIRAEVSDKAQSLGIEMVDVQIRRADLPAETSVAIYNRMKSERERQAKELRAQGFEWAQQIQSRADRDRSVLLADAQRQSRIIRGQGDAEASRLFADAYGKDPEFFDLYRTLQAYRQALVDNSPTLVLTPDSAFLRYFNAGSLRHPVPFRPVTGETP